MAKGTHAYYSVIKNVNLTAKMIVHSLLIFLFFYTLIILSLFCFFYSNWSHTTYLYFKYAYDDLLAKNLNSFYENTKNGILFFIKYFFKIYTVNLFAWIFYPIILYTIKRLKVNSNFIRGVQLEDKDTIIKKIGDEPTRLPIGPLFLPIANEVRNFFVGGRPGVGKTTLFSLWIETVIKDNQKGIIYDSKKDYIVKFYREDKDLIANPFDKRCIRWTVLNDATTVMDLSSIAHSIIPSAPEGTEPVWYDSPREILYAILLFCHTRNRRLNKDVWEVLNFGPKKLLNALKFIEGAEAACAVLESHKDVLSTFMNMLMKHAKIFELLQHFDGDFSIREWIKSDEKNFIFLPSYTDIKVAMQPFFSLFIETVGRALIALPNHLDRRIFFFLDEFGTVQKMDMLIDILTQSRSKGGAVFLGTQEVVRIDSIYGEKLREAILNACSNSITFSLEDTTDSEIFSRKLGEIEYWEDQQSISKGEKKDQVTMSKQKRKEYVALASQIQNLQDLTAYVRLANYGLTFVEFEHVPIPEDKEGFILHDYYSLENRNIKNEIKSNLKIVSEQNVSSTKEEKIIDITNLVVEEENKIQEEKKPITKSKSVSLAEF